MGWTGLTWGITITVETPMDLLGQAGFSATKQAQSLNTVQYPFVQKSRYLIFLLTMRDQLEGIEMEATHTPL